MAQARRPQRPKNREVENQDLRPPAQEGEPPRAATEPPGSEWSVQSEETMTDPVSGEPREEKERRERGQEAWDRLTRSSGSRPHTSG